MKEALQKALCFYYYDFIKEGTVAETPEKAINIFNDFEQIEQNDVFYYLTEEGKELIDTLCYLKNNGVDLTPSNEKEADQFEEMFVRIMIEQGDPDAKYYFKK